MAERRMMSKKIIDSDAFTEMPLSSQALYFHLLLRADDDGFLNNAKKIMRDVGANQNDYDMLLMKRFIIPVSYTHLGDCHPYWIAVSGISTGC